ncbi:hypothetical protein [Alicyclobacillus macrosporangiidus]|uniref:Uncharacterized protein n=1 Tax=Alicyclobacillus macrosporangiidus TaxID=392015 RepID=A0A1I7LBU9_9BACL|nr:hypothetical protein [Alicyclobacillus macrosporangiidus]SFV07004.1 hypothetical protein SAMN05421543_1334 [Alicyclobacillus macrosporangiidus]
MDVHDLVQAVVERVKQQVEMDNWDDLMEKHFDGLCEEFFDRVQRLTRTVENMLAAYPQKSVKKVWEADRSEGRFYIRFGDRELNFIPIREASTLPGDRWTMQITRRDDELVGRYFVQLDPRTGTLRFATLVSGAIAQRVEERHLLDLLEQELLGS